MANDTLNGNIGGSTGDPAAFTEIVQVVRDKFGLAKMVMVGDRGMITSARIEALNTDADGSQLPEQDRYGWITALRAPAIKKLMPHASTTKTAGPTAASAAC
jgi:uncharacterized membrane protein